MSEMSSTTTGGSYGTIGNSTHSTKGGGSRSNTSSQLIVREEDRFRTDAPYQDKMFAILFIIWLLLISILSLYFYMQNKDTFDSNSPNSNNDYLNQHFWKLITISIVISLCTTCIMLMIVRKFADFVIWFSLIVSFLFFVIYGFIIMFSFGSIWVGISVLFIAFIQFIWIFLIRHRVQFTTALLILSMDALNKFTATYFISLLCSILQILWLIIWSMGFSYSIGGTQSTKAVIFLYVIAYYWTFQVITNICYSSISGCVAFWYFLYPNRRATYVVYYAFKRAITTSFGSIAYGSLIIAIMQAIKTCIDMLRSLVRDNRRHNACINCVNVCIVGFTNCVRNTIEYINCYAFVRMSIYGTNYCFSANQTMYLFTSRGFDSIINDDLTNAVLLISCLLCSSFNGLIIGIVSKYQYGNGSIETIVLWSATAFAISFAISMSCIVTIKAATHTIFVCFAEDPAVLSFTKPLKYDFLTKAWNQRYGSLPKKLTNPPRNP